MGREIVSVDDARDMHGCVTAGKSDGELQGSDPVPHLRAADGHSRGANLPDPARMRCESCRRFLPVAGADQLPEAPRPVVSVGDAFFASPILQSVEGRKIWFATKMTDGPDGVVYAEARTLFIVARKDDVVDS